MPHGLTLPAWSTCCYGRLCSTAVASPRAARPGREVLSGLSAGLLPVVLMVMVITSVPALVTIGEVSGDMHKQGFCLSLSL
jgi:hypothetical protein